MKFLLFNGIVAAALYYLVTGGFDPAPGLEALQPLRTAITGAVSDARVAPRPAVPANAPAAAAPVEVQVQPAPAPQPTQAAAANPPAPAAAPVAEDELAPLPEIIVEARPEPVAAPPAAVARIDTNDEAIRARRAEVLGEPATAGGEAPHEPKFMTPRERLAELQRLSDEMELFFVEKTVH